MTKSKRLHVPFRHTDDELRAMYVGGKGDLSARRYARFWSSIFGLGLFPRRWVSLEVIGRGSGETRRFPLGTARLNGSRYLVSMLGDECNWVKNVRATGGEALLRHGRATNVKLIEIPSGERASIIKSYLEQVPGARPHFAVSRNASLEDFQKIASQYPVFLISDSAK